MIDHIRTTARRATLTVLALYWSLIFASTHLPLPSSTDIELNDKLAHVVAYGGLGFLLAWTVLRFRPTRTGVVMLVLIIAAYGAADEVSQLLVPSRQMDLADWLADMCGGLAGLVLYFVSHRYVAGWFNRPCSVAVAGEKDIA